MMELKLYIQIGCSVVSVICVLVFYLVCRPLRMSKRPEDKLFRILCLVAAVLGLFNIVRDYQYLFHPFAFYSVLGVAALYLPDLIFLFYVLIWHLFVDAAISGSRDRIKFKLRYAIIPYAIMVGLLCIAYYLLQLVEKDIERYGDVLEKTNRLFTIWSWVYYVVAVIIIFGYLALSFRHLHYYHKNRKQPLFLRLDVFILPWIVAFVVQNLPPMFIMIDSLCAFISLLFTWLSMRNRFKYMDPETDFYKEEFIPFLEKYAIEHKVDRTCSIMRIDCSDLAKGAEVIRKNKPEYSIVIEMEEGFFFLISAITRKNAFLLLDNCLMETARTEAPDLEIRSSFWTKKSTEALGEFALRVMGECRNSA